MTRKALTALALLLVPVAAYGAVPASASVDPAALAAARDLMTVTDVRGQMRALGPQMAEAIGLQLRQMFTDQRVPDGLATQVAAAMQANFASMSDAFTPAVVDQVATVYARHFTVAELRRLTELMRDPVMTKFRDEMPRTMGEMMPILFEAMKPQQAIFQAKMRQIIADWMRSHPEDKARLRSPIAS